MRLLLFAVAVVLVLAGRTAGADPTGSAAAPATAEPIYPESVVDRPLLLLGGMTTLDLGLDFRTYLQTTVDANGNTATSKTSLWDDHAADVVVTHSFGSFEIGGRLLGNKTGPFLQAHLRTYLGPIPGALTITADIKATQENSAFDHEYFEDVGYTYKAVVVPHQLALYGDANVEITEVAFKPVAMSSTGGTYVFGGTGVGAEAQITPRLELDLGAGVSFPIRQPVGTSTTAFETSVGLRYVLGHWDFYGQLGLSDVTDSRLPFLNIGAVHRWGGNAQPATTAPSASRRSAPSSMPAATGAAPGT